MPDLQRLPSLPLAEWEDTRLTWQLICQIAGKVRLKLHPFMNHWWHVTLYVSPQGLTTGAIPYPGGQLSIEFDVFRHVLIVQCSSGERREVPLAGTAVADVYSKVMLALAGIGVHVEIGDEPYKCKSSIPFPQDTVHHQYAPDKVFRAWSVWAGVEPVFKEFRSRFVGKCSPVQIFWHSFDMACTRFSGRRAPAMPEADKVTQEAYSHEVISAGFWFGDDKVPEPAFYSYVAPKPDGLAKEPLSDKAFWSDEAGSMALLKYEDFRTAPDPKAMLLDFFQSAYEAGAKLANWDRAPLDRRQP